MKIHDGENFDNASLFKMHSFIISDDSIRILSDYTSNSAFQYTVDGVNTEIGVLAVLNVEEEPRIALGPALTLLQKMVVMSVREKLRIHWLVTRTLVQVRNNSAG